MRGDGDIHGVSTTEGSSSKEGRLNNLKNALIDWRELFIAAQDVLLWKKTFYSYIIAGLITFLFLLWCWMEVSVLTTLAILLFVVVTTDYALSSFGSKLRGGKPWEGEQEEQYGHVCQQMLDAYDNVLGCWMFIQTKKTSSPKSYMGCVTATLFMLGLIGYAVNNTFLLYLFVLSICLLPGAFHRGFVQRYYGKICQQVQTLMAKKERHNVKKD